MEKKKLRDTLKEWTTTKTSLYAAMLAVVIFTIISVGFNVFSLVTTGMASYLDPTLTGEWFNFWVVVVGGGGTVSIFKMFNTDKPKKAPKIKLSINDDEGEKTSEI